MGLTIFAMGNSLGDFVANVTIARMGFPVMAISACFGGPMLNILFGVGLSGTWLISRNGGEHYPLHLGRPLWISGVGLLAILSGTLVFVWWSDWWMTRRLGVGLIAVYLSILAVNVSLSIGSP
ncbi:hypothetical protein BT69DRAFT_1338011 [Atractiella rhizophila]|nr:hypothetical protein BT69DRAFT_1338011 [Atractiella rhizophila]